MARLARNDPSRSPHGPEPVTEGLIKLLLWLAGPPRRTGAMLARACGYSQQRLSYILCRYSRPAPDTELAQLIALVTEGQVPPEGWLTTEERRAWQASRERAATHGRRLAALAGGGLAPPEGRQHVPALGDLGPRLGLAPVEVPQRSARPRRTGRRGVSRFAPDMAADTAPGGSPAPQAEPTPDARPSGGGDDVRRLAEVATEALVAELAARVQPRSVGALSVKE